MFLINLCILIIEYTLFIQSFKFLGAGLSTIALAGAGVGIGHIFANLLVAIAIAPENTETLFSYAILGFALTEAIALFGLMMAFLILFAL